VRPVSFKFGSKTITDQSKIAATCKVPYRVGLIVSAKTAALRYYQTHADYRVYRVVEGEQEDDPFIISLNMLSSLSGSYSQNDLGYWPKVNSPVFRYYRNKGVDILLSRVTTGSGVDSDISSLTGDDTSEWFSDLNHICGQKAYKYTLRRAAVSRSREKDAEVSWFNVGFGDGASPSTVGVYDLMLKDSGGVISSGAGNVLPDYGLRVTDNQRQIMSPPYYSMPEEMKGSFVWDSGHTSLELKFSSSAISALKSIVVYTSVGSWDSEETKYSFNSSTMGKTYSSPYTSFTVRGTYNGSTVNSTVNFNLYNSLKLTDVYDGFKMTVADYVDGSIMLGGFSGKFEYTRGEDKAYAFGSEISATEKNVTDGS